MGFYLEAACKNLGGGAYGKEENVSLRPSTLGVGAALRFCARALRDSLLGRHSGVIFLRSINIPG
jgi:hypothetical protein